jgi:ATP-dependent Clp protease protease subunit
VGAVVIKKKQPLNPPQRYLKADEEDEEEEEGQPSFPFPFPPLLKDEQELEQRGIIFILGGISKESLMRAYKKILALHFDKDFSETIQVIINSPGGYTDAAWALIDLFSFCKHPIRTIALGEICSAATNIFISGDERIMALNSCAMIHQFSWQTAGNYSDLVASRKAEDMEHKREIEHLTRHSKYTTKKEVRKHLLLDKDHWLTPEEMKKHGLCDEVSPPKRKKRKTSKKAAKRKKKKRKK